MADENAGTAARAPGENIGKKAKLLSKHKDRLDAIKRRRGVRKKADNMKSQDQGGSAQRPKVANGDAGEGVKMRGPKMANYSRKRHP